MYHSRFALFAFLATSNAFSITPTASRGRRTAAPPTFLEAGTASADKSLEVEIFGLELPSFFKPYERTAWEDDNPTAFIGAAFAIVQKQTRKPVDKQGKEAWPEAFLQMQDLAKKTVIKTNPDDPDPVEGYLSFGNQEHSKNLAKLCQVNPFWASALTVSEDGKYLELNAYSESPKSDSDPKYLSIVRELTDPSHRINLHFNMDWTINQIVTYESGEKVVVPKEEWEFYASGVSYNMVYYSSCIHAMIHVFHYWMTTGIQQSTSHDKSLAAWADPYDDNIPAKYVQVAETLFDSNMPGRGGPDGKVLTGKSGFGGTTELMPVVKKYLRIVGHCKSVDDFNKNFLLQDLHDTTENLDKVLADADILTEFMKHSNNIKPFARDLTKAMRGGLFDIFSQRLAFNKAETNLKKFMKECGEDVFSINSISSWVQLMSVTGIVHGSTLSYSRMLLTPDIIRWREINASDSNYKTEDISLSLIGALTTQGLYDDRHTFTGHIAARPPTSPGPIKGWNTEPINCEVRDVLNKYDKKAEKIKTAYEKSIQQRDDFREYGWILTDHCNDGFDGKQHTITTYF